MCRPTAIGSVVLQGTPRRHMECAYYLTSHGMCLAPSSQAGGYLTALTVLTRLTALTADSIDRVVVAVSQRRKAACQ